MDTEITQPTPTIDTEVMAPAQIDRAEIDLQIATAHRFPRSVVKAKGAMLSIATLDPDTAATCFYTLPRAQKAIQGPSIRMAEIALSCWGNLRAATRIVSVDARGDNPTVEVEGMVHDLETNVAIRMAKRRRITKKKSKEFPDEDDINLAANAGSAIVLRDAIFKIVPRSIVLPVLAEAKRVAAGDAKSLAQRRDAVVARLKVLGVLEHRICAAVGVTKVEEIDLEKLGELIGLGTAIRDGQTSIEEAFPEPDVTGTTNAREAFGVGTSKVEAAPPASEPANPPRVTTVSAQGQHDQDGDLVPQPPAPQAAPAAKKKAARRVEPTQAQSAPTPAPAEATSTPQKASPFTPPPQPAVVEKPVDPSVSRAMNLKQQVEEIGKTFADAAQVLLSVEVIKEIPAGWRDFTDLPPDVVSTALENIDDFKAMLLQ